jgi:hypothetical protein
MAMTKVQMIAKKNAFIKFNNYQNEAISATTCENTEGR